MSEDESPKAEPMFNAPWPAVAVPLVLVAVHLWLYNFASQATFINLALSGEAVATGRYQTLVTYAFLHGGLAHLAMNSIAAFAFGPPVVRLLGRGVAGALSFFGFFLVCGIASGLGFVLLHWGSPELVVGASGAVSGLWGAASRLLGGRGRLAPIFARNVLMQALAFTIVNVVVGLLGGFSGLPIAWEAHLVGYAAGLALIGPWASLAHRPA